MIKISDVLERVSTKEILEFYGVQFNNRNFALCPFHSEKTPSLSYNPKTDKYKCFSCGKGGDGINFVCEYFNLSTPQALKKIDNDFSLGLDRPLTNVERKRQAEEQKITDRLNTADKALKEENRRLYDLWSSIFRQIQNTDNDGLRNKIEEALDAYTDESIRFLLDMLAGKEIVFIIKMGAKNLMEKKIDKDEFYGICKLFQQAWDKDKGAEVYTQPNLHQPKFTMNFKEKNSFFSKQEFRKEAYAGIEL